MFCLLLSYMLYTLEGVTPDITASSLAFMFRSLHMFLNLSTTAFFYSHKKDLLSIQIQESFTEREFSI